MGWRAFKRGSLGRTYWLNSQAWTLENVHIVAKEPWY